MMARVYRIILLGVVIVYTLGPIMAIFAASLGSGRVPILGGNEINLRGYSDVFKSSVVHEAFATSLGVALVVAVISVALGFSSARLVRKVSPGLMIACIIAICIPALLPILVSGFSLHVYYQQIGLDGTLWGIIAAHVVYTSPFAFFLLHVSHYSLNAELEECARNLGASESEIALRVILPQLRKVCVAAGIICGLISWDEFMLAWFVSGFHKTVPTLTYGMLGNTLDPSLYSIGALVTFVSLALLTLAAYIMRGELANALVRK